MKVVALSIEEIPEEINVHRKIFGKDPVVNYDNIGLIPFCNCRIDEFNFCACGGNLVSVSNKTFILSSLE